jgi:signal transduction histidine kinase/CheY-like chemotaxis protein
MGIVTDITDRKKAEEQLHKQYSEYQKLSEMYQAKNQELIGSIDRIKKINSELEEARIKAEESDKLKTAFLANRNHEIRTPMNGILGFTELLKETELTGKQKQKYIEVIQQSGRRMLDIINDLIDISKIESGQVEIKMHDLNLNDMLDGLYNFFKYDAGTKGLILTCIKEVDHEKSNIRTDETKLQQVFSNLIKNSIKYTNTGSIEFGYSLKGTDIEFFVKDTGIGIKREIHQKIFERFRKGNVSDNKEYEGSGLGLSISKAYVEMLEGKIWLDSEPGKGTVFYFILPGISFMETKTNPKAEYVSSPDVLKGITILVAEDDEISFILLKEVLKRAGAEVIHAVNGKEAVELVIATPDIDIVLMDIKMPVLNDTEAAKLIKKINTDLPIIVQTAYALSTDHQKYLDIGCNDYIAKPIERRLLIDKIVKHIREKDKTGVQDKRNDLLNI